jgi:hypothetical protein
MNLVRCVGLLQVVPSRPRNGKALKALPFRDATTALSGKRQELEGSVRYFAMGCVIGKPNIHREFSVSTQLHAGKRKPARGGVSVKRAGADLRLASGGGDPSQRAPASLRISLRIPLL